MRHFLYFIFFLLLSNDSFAHDSFLNYIDSQFRTRPNWDSFQAARTNRGDHSSIFIDTTGMRESIIELENLSLLVSKQKATFKDTISLYDIKYDLNNTEIDSIWHSIYLRAQTQQLLEAYLKKKHCFIFLPENNVNLISIFKSNKFPYKTKQHLLADKIRFDDQNISKTKNVTRSYLVKPGISYQQLPWHTSALNQGNPHLDLITFESKEQAVSEYLKNIEREAVANNQTVEIRVSIKRTGMYSGTDYFIRYFQYDGIGQLKCYDDPSYQPNDLYELPSEQFRLYYTSLSTVSESFSIWISDSFGNEREVKFEFNNKD